MFNCSGGKEIQREVALMGGKQRLRELSAKMDDLKLKRIEELEAEKQMVEKERDDLKAKFEALVAHTQVQTIPDVTAKAKTREEASEFMHLLREIGITDTNLRDEEIVERFGHVHKFTEPFKRVRSSRVVVALPITAPCCGKTTMILEFQTWFAKCKSVNTLNFINDTEMTHLREMGADLQAVLVVKSSDEFKKRKMDENKDLTEEAAMKLTHTGFWEELGNDFEEICKFASETTVPCILLIDKNHMYNTFDRTKGLQTNAHGWTFTMHSLNKRMAKLRKSREVRNVELQYLALTVRELVMGLDYNPNVWPHPFLPELALELLRRARTRTGHLTRSKDEKDWAIRIMKFMKTFTNNEMLPECSTLESKSKQSLSMLRSKGFHHFHTISLLEHQEGVVRTVALTTDEVESLAKAFERCPNYWDKVQPDELDNIITDINAAVTPLLGIIDKLLKANTVDNVAHQCVEALESALRDTPCPLSKAHELCEMYRVRHRKDNRVYEYEQNPELFFMGLEQIIGPPLSNVFHAMLQEHDDNELFEYCAPIEGFPKRETSPLKEWVYIVAGSAGERIPEHKPERDYDTRGDRRGVINLVFFCRHETARKASLTREEVIALRLYTGPMFKKYNESLRYKLRRFTTTIHVLASGIQKLARSCSVERLYRGISGGILPKHFWFPDKSTGIRGGIDRGFMSTSTNKDVAIAYSRPNLGATKCSIVFDIQTGTSDRGAHLQWVSQYPIEEEVLYAPLTALDVVGQPQIETVPSGQIVVVKLRISCNQTDMCAVGRAKRWFMKLAGNVIAELRENGAPVRSVKVIENELEEHANREDCVFDKSESFQKFISELMAQKKQVETNLCAERTEWLLIPDAAERVKHIMSFALMLRYQGEHQSSCNMLERMKPEGLVDLSDKAKYYEFYSSALSAKEGHKEFKERDLREYAKAANEAKVAIALRKEIIQKGGQGVSQRRGSLAAQPSEILKDSRKKLVRCLIQLADALMKQANCHKDHGEGKGGGGGGEGEAEEKAEERPISHTCRIEAEVLFREATEVLTEAHQYIDEFEDSGACDNLKGKALLAQGNLAKNKYRKAKGFSAENKTKGPQHGDLGKNALTLYHQALGVYEKEHTYSTDPGYCSALLNISIVYEDMGDAYISRELLYRYRAVQCTHESPAREFGLRKMLANTLKRLKRPEEAKMVQDGHHLRSTEELFGDRYESWAECSSWQQRQTEDFMPHLQSSVCSSPVPRRMLVPNTKGA